MLSYINVATTYSSNITIINHVVIQLIFIDIILFSLNQYRATADS